MGLKELENISTFSIDMGSNSSGDMEGMTRLEKSSNKSGV
jgi:hypothetical protein